MADIQKDLNDTLDEKEAKNPGNAVYVLNFRYIGGCRDTQGLEKKLKNVGWIKVADLTACYALKVTNADDINLHQTKVEEYLRDYVSLDKRGAGVHYGISRYIPPNQRPDNYEGIDTLFDEHIEDVEQ